MDRPRLERAHPAESPFAVRELPAVLAQPVIFSSIGIATALKLRAAGAPVTGLGWSIAGLVIGVLTGLYYLLIIARLLFQFLGVSN